MSDQKTTNPETRPKPFEPAELVAFRARPMTDDAGRLLSTLDGALRSYLGLVASLNSPVALLKMLDLMTAMGVPDPTGPRT